MLINCDNKGCMKSSNALLNEAGEVICQECKKPITNVAGPMKRALKSFGQVIRSEKKAFMLACPKCKSNREVVLDQNNNTLCKTCHAEIKITPSFKLAMEESGGLEKIDTSKTKKKRAKKARK